MSAVTSSETTVPGFELGLLETGCHGFNVPCMVHRSFVHVVIHSELRIESNASCTPSEFCISKLHLQPEEDLGCGLVGKVLAWQS